MIINSSSKHYGILQIQFHMLAFQLVALNCNIEQRLFYVGTGFAHSLYMCTLKHKSYLVCPTSSIE